jgi:hypothetical protein
MICLEIGYRDVTIARETGGHAEGWRRAKGAAMHGHLFKNLVAKVFEEG